MFLHVVMIESFVSIISPKLCLLLKLSVVILPFEKIVVDFWSFLIILPNTEGML